MRLSRRRVYRYSERPHELARKHFVAGWFGAFLGCLAVTTQAQAQTGATNTQFYAPFREDVAEELLERSVTATRLAPQPYMREVFWGFPNDTPAFFRDSLMQIVARSYYLTRDNFDGSRSRAWAGGGWLAYRSGLIGDIFGAHAALYVSEPLFAPTNEGGTKLLSPEQGPLSMLGQAYARVKIFDQEFRGGRQLVDALLINPQDSRMVPNTFEGVTLVSLPDPKREYGLRLVGSRP
jgi:outer membrane porin, OprD family